MRVWVLHVCFRRWTTPRTAFKAGVLWKCATCLQTTCRWNVRRPLLGHLKIVLGTFGLRQVLWIIKALMKPRTRVEFWRIYACNWEKGVESTYYRGRSLSKEEKRWVFYGTEKNRIEYGEMWHGMYCVFIRCTHFVLLIYFSYYHWKAFCRETCRKT